MSNHGVFNLTRVTVAGRSSPRLHVDDLSIGAGITAVIGPSGAGKTTLLDVLVGFAKPATGTLEFTPVIRQDGGGLPLFWSPTEHGLWPHLTSREHLTAVAPAGDAHDWLDRFGLDDVATVRPGQLSQGQRSRLGVVRALASDAGVLVLDEPLLHVDPARAGGYWQVLVDTLRATGRTLVFATHEPAWVLAFADSVICLDHGAVVYHGPVDDLYLRPASEALAGCLGVANWIPPNEATEWTDAAAPRCLRPEHLAIESDPQSELIVRETVHHGPVSASVVESKATRRTRRFHHRTSSPSPCPGTRVALRICLLSVLSMALASCDAGDDPVLPMHATAHFQLPPAGTRRPKPRGLVALENGGLIVLDNAGRVLVLDRNHQPVRSWEMPAHDVGKPEGVCLLRDGRIAVADTHYSRVVFFDGDGTVSATMGDRGTGEGQFLFPIKVTQDPGGHLYVAEYGSNDRVQKFTEDGRYLLSFGSFGTGPGQFQRPSGLVWHAGKVFVADAVNHRILMFSDGGDYLGVVDDPDRPLDLAMPYDLSLGPGGDLYACEWGAGRVTRFTTGGRLVGRLGTVGRGLGQMRTPWGLTVSRDGRVIVADTGNQRLVEWR